MADWTGFEAVAPVYTGRSEAGIPDGHVGIHKGARRIELSLDLTQRLVAWAADQGVEAKAMTFTPKVFAEEGANGLAFQILAFAGEGGNVIPPDTWKGETPLAIGTGMALFGAVLTRLGSGTKASQLDRQYFPATASISKKAASVTFYFDPEALEYCAG